MSKWEIKFFLCINEGKVAYQRGETAAKTSSQIRVTLGTIRLSSVN